MTLTPPTITPEQIYNEHGQFSFVNLNSPEHYTAFAQAILALNNAAWLEMLAGQEPFGQVTVRHLSGPNQLPCYEFYTWPQLPYLDNAHECHMLYAAPVPAQAPAVAVPDDKPHGCIKPDTSTHVYFYEQDFYVLSNFSAFRVTFDGQTFDTSEAAYHYQRFTDAEDRRGVQYANSAHEAFRYAQDCKAYQRPDWDQIKVRVMKDILRAKVQQHEYVRRKLLATGDRVLVEDSWRDDFWGWGPNRDGQNMLGKLWMEVRSELTAAQAGEGGV